MKNQQIHPELVRLFVALEDVYNSFGALSDEEGSFLNESEYNPFTRDFENALGDARVQLSELINVDIVQRAKAASTRPEIEFKTNEMF